jgi:diguanylate cyclase (GGDEF)-like protein
MRRMNWFRERKRQKTTSIYAVGEPSLEAVRLRIYAAAFPIGMIALFTIYLSGIIQNRLHIYQLIAHPLIALLAVISAITVRRKPATLRVIEKIGFVLVAGYLLIQYYSTIVIGYTQGERQLFTTFPQWLPIIYFLAFLMFTTRKAMLASAIVFVLLLIPTIVLVLMNGLRSHEVVDLHALLQIHFSHAIYIPLLSGIALLKEHYVGASARANAFAQLATTDYLTGVANRRSAEQSLDQAISRAKRYQRNLSIILLDIDSFKQINDTYGHSAGDHVLIQLVQIIRTQLRSSDICGRWGGEEFIIIAPETSATQALLFAERLRAQVASQDIFPTGRFTASFGVSAMKPDDTVASLVKQADKALYLAKQNGRNRVEYQA